MGFLSEIILRSGKKGGLGMIDRPDYYAGCPASDNYFSGEKLFLLWQEIYLREEMWKISMGSAYHFQLLVESMEFLRPDEFLLNLLRYYSNGFRFVEGNSKVSTEDELIGSDRFLRSSDRTQRSSFS